MSKLLGIFVVMFQLTRVVCGTESGVDLRWLEIQSDAIEHKLWRQSPVLEKDIRDGLGCVKNLQEVDQKYKQPDSFQTFYDEAFDKFDHREAALLNFLQSCKSLYDEGNDKDKVAIYLLCEHVTQKHLENLHKADFAKESMSSIKKSENGINPDQLLNAFKNADQGIGLSTSRISSVGSPDSDMLRLFTKVH